MERMTIGEWLDLAATRLGEVGIESGRLEAAVLLAAVLKVDRSWVLAHTSDTLHQVIEADRVLARRLAREPLAYLTGTREFFGRQFKVGPGVLVPRQETEVLVEAALAVAQPGWTVADLGTGSGCIAITLMLERPDLMVFGLDISPAALAYAHENAEILGGRVEFVRGDGVDWIARNPVDLVVTNPPYVGTRDRLPPEVADHEPPEALYAGPDGLDFFMRLAAVERPGLRLLTEVGDGQAPEVTEVFGHAGWESEGLWRDLAGRVRVLEFRLP